MTAGAGRPPCAVSGCPKQARTLGLYGMHHARYLRTGTTELTDRRTVREEAIWTARLDLLAAFTRQHGRLPAQRELVEGGPVGLLGGDAALELPDRHPER